MLFFSDSVNSLLANFRENDVSAIPKCAAI